MEVDLEAGLGIFSGKGNPNGSFVVRFGEPTAYEVRDLEYSEHIVRFQVGMKPVKGEKKKSKKPPKPPRPPKGPVLDAYDLKLIKELSQLALERRLRIERIKDLKKKRASKAAVSSSNSSLVSLIVTILFFLIILFQGVSSRYSSVIKSEASSAPVLSPAGEESLSLQILKILSPADYDNGVSSESQKGLFLQFQNLQHELLLDEIHDAPLCNSISTPDSKLSV